MRQTQLTTFLAIPLVAASAYAQSPKTQAVLMAMNANGKQMIGYQWKQKTTVFRKGNPVGVTIDEVRMDPSGQLNRMNIVAPEEKKMGPLRAHKAAEIKSDIQEVMRMAAVYANPRQIADAVRSGEMWEGPNAFRVHARNLQHPRDEMDLSINPASLLPQQIDFKALYEGSPVSIAVEWEQFPGGPATMTRMTVRIPREDVLVRVESFDFRRLSGPIVR